MTRLTRADLEALPSYVPARRPADLAGELGLTEAIKLASNEVPYGPLPGVVEAITEAAGGGHRYPDLGVGALRGAPAERRMMLVRNPNNPTGTSIRRTDLDRFLDAVPDDVLVVLDEAYREFVTDPGVP